MIAACCQIWAMEVTHSITIGRPRSVTPPRPRVRIGGEQTQRVSGARVLGPTRDSHLTLERHVRSLQSNTYACIWVHSKYGAPVWMSATNEPLFSGSERGICTLSYRTDPRIRFQLFICQVFLISAASILSAASASLTGASSVLTSWKSAAATSRSPGGCYYETVI